VSYYPGNAPGGDASGEARRSTPGKRWGRRILVGAVGIGLVLALLVACGGGSRAACRDDYREDYYAKHAAHPTQAQVNSACGRSGGGLGWIFLGGGSRSSGTDYRGGSFGSGK
jgi:hypothetical protein